MDLWWHLHSRIPHVWKTIWWGLLGAPHLGMCSCDRLFTEHTFLPTMVDTQASIHLLRSWQFRRLDEEAVVHFWCEPQKYSITYIENTQWATMLGCKPPCHSGWVDWAFENLEGLWCSIHHHYKANKGFVGPTFVSLRLRPTQPNHRYVWWVRQQRHLDTQLGK